MTKVIFRYLLAEITRTWFIVAAVLVFLMLGLGFSRFIADAAAGELPVDTILFLALLNGVKNLGIVLPVSVLLGVLLTLGRMCRDNEMAALLTNGAGLATVYRPFFVLAISVAALAGALSIVAAPQAERAMNQLSAASVTAMLESLAPGRFRTFLDGDAVFYAQSRDAEGDLRRIFIRVVRDDADGESTQTVVTADRARQQTDPDTGRITLVLDDGWRYEGAPGQANYRIVKFAEHGVQLAPPVADASNNVDTQGFARLLASNDPEAIAEWQQRVSVPLSIVILTLLALPLGRVPPRSGRYARVIVGILFCVIYVNAIELAATSIEDGVLPSWLGVWWVHGLVLLLAVILVAREQGLFARGAARLSE